MLPFTEQSLQNHMSYTIDLLSLNRETHEPLKKSDHKTSGSSEDLNGAIIN